MLKFKHKDGEVEFSPVDMGEIRLDISEKFDINNPSPKPPIVKSKGAIEARWVILSMEKYGKPRDKRVYEQAVAEAVESEDLLDRNYLQQKEDWELNRLIFELSLVFERAIVGQEDELRKILASAELSAKLYNKIIYYSELNGDIVWKYVRMFGRKYNGIDFETEYNRRTSNSEGYSDTWEGIATDMAIANNVYPYFISADIEAKAKLTASLLIKSCLESWAIEDRRKKNVTSR